METRAQALSPQSPSTRNWVRGDIIGTGSFGTVCVAVDKCGGPVFASKSVSLSSSPLASIDALENEIQILKSLSSPYVVSYVGDDTTEESTAGACRNLHLEYMPGGTVAELAAKGGAIGEDEAKIYTRCIARALHYLHSVAGVVHGDVKGRNVLIGGGRGVAAKLADFGSARRNPDAGAEGGRRLAQGTPLWMAPEVARGEPPTPASDVWSLGCTVIEMVTGAQPWQDRRPGDAAGAIFHIAFGHAVPEFPARMSKAGRDFLGKCLRRDAGQRWTSEQLLRHPFLADAGVTGPSPRSVLDWADSEIFHDGGDSDDRTCDAGEVMASARERARQLASNGVVVGWDWEDDGWELVRRAEERNPQASDLVGGGGEKGVGISRGFLELGEAGEQGVASEASGGRLTNSMRCSVSSCCCCRRRCWGFYCCCGCKDGLGRQLASGILWGLFFCWWDAFLPLIAVDVIFNLLPLINAIRNLFPLVSLELRIHILTLSMKLRRILGSVIYLTSQ